MPKWATGTCQKHSVEQARSAISRFAVSPLSAVADALQRALEAGSQAGISPTEMTALAEYIVKITDRLPQTFEERFWFDAALIQAIANAWSEEPLFPSMLVPAYDREWGHARLPMPLSEPANSQGFRLHVLELILFPRSPNLREVNLLEYPWLAHELAHSLMFRFDELLVKRVDPVFSSIVRRRRLAAAADRDRIRTVALSAINEFQTLWRPTPDHRNWTHEISADLIAASLLGPVYFAAFTDLLDGDSKNPYQVSPGHPPYVLRVTALQRIGNRLGFPTKDLDRLEDSFAKSRWRSGRSNKLLSLADAELVEAILEGVQHLCKNLRLRPWNAGRVKELGATIQQETPALGVDLLTAAWMAFNEFGENQYSVWQKRIIQAHVDGFTQ